MYTIHEVLFGSFSKFGNNTRDQDDTRTRKSLVRKS